MENELAIVEQNLAPKDDEVSEKKNALVEYTKNETAEQKYYRIEKAQQTRKENRALKKTINACMEREIVYTDPLDGQKKKGLIADFVIATQLSIAVDRNHKHCVDAYKALANTIGEQKSEEQPSNTIRIIFGDNGDIDV